MFERPKKVEDVIQLSDGQQGRVWIADFGERRFRAEDEDIPFPQQDLHLRSVDVKVADRLKDNPIAPAEPFSSAKASVPESE